MLIRLFRKGNNERHRAKYSIWSLLSDIIHLFNLSFNQSIMAKEVKIYEEIQPRTFYGLGKKLKYKEVKLEVSEEIDGCENCFFDLKDCNGIYQCLPGSIFKEITK